MKKVLSIIACIVFLGTGIGVGMSVNNSKVNADTTQVTETAAPETTADRLNGKVILMDTIYKGVILDESEVDTYLSAVGDSTMGGYLKRAYTEGQCHHDSTLNCDIYIYKDAKYRDVRFTTAENGRMYYLAGGDWELSMSDFVNSEVVTGEYGSFTVYTAK